MRYEIWGRKRNVHHLGVVTLPENGCHPVGRGHRINVIAVVVDEVRVVDVFHPEEDQGAFNSCIGTHSVTPPCLVRNLFSSLDVQRFFIGNGNVDEVRRLVDEVLLDDLWFQFPFIHRNILVLQIKDALDLRFKDS